MHLPIHPISPAPDSTALAQDLVREDVLWSRPVFKAPPLESFLPDFDAAAIAEEFRRSGWNQR